MQAHAAAPRSRKTLAWMVATQLLALASLLPWLAVVAGTSLLAFDAPVSAEAVAPRVFMGVVWSYPLLPLGCAAAAWLAYARRRYRRAAVLSAVPLLPALPLLAYLLWVSSPA
ncbi:MAG: hypothetical protein AB1941_03610 [Gemmatimonadota bacterium]